MKAIGSKRLALFALVTLMLLAAGCAGSLSGAAPASPTKNADGYTDITPQQLKSMLAAKDFTLVNVHIPYQGELPQTDLFIPYDQIADNQGKLPDKNARIVLYCRSGAMSTQAAKALVGLGYTNVLELDGGFYAWQAAGYEVLNKPQQ
jgi:rhodanese-related sulfurtransferase